MNDKSNIPPAVGEFTMQERAKLLSDNADLRARLAKYEDAEGNQISWQASGAEYDRNIHRNPDAKAWADLFVATFQALADKHGLMLGWFANAMMAMHDHLKAQPGGVVLPEPLKRGDEVVKDENI